ncbi:MAG: FliH/SctL family protein [Bryobacterales bacterium]|jgi:flagellar biosynthesis/type III secretory pathway protein FliH|nr:FliH/SctL family protein [Bryobacterales bacterium]
MEGRILKGAVGAGAIVRQPLLQAAEEAREILTQAHQERDRIRQEAREQGFREGFQQWDTAIRRVKDTTDTYVREHQQDFLKLAVRIAEKILGDSLRADPQQIIQVVREALRNLSRERRLTIEVAPGQGDFLESQRQALEARVGQDCTVRILETPEVSPGGCLLRSDLGIIDARVETQLALLERALLAGTTRDDVELSSRPPISGPEASVSSIASDEGAR